MKIDDAIISSLREAGEQGLAVRKLVTHVYNICNSMFEPLNLNDTYDYVTRYLYSHPSIIEKTGQRGHYRLNEDSEDTQQLLFNFFVDRDETNIDDTENLEDIDNSLNLF